MSKGRGLAAAFGQDVEREVLAPATLLFLAHPTRGMSWTLEVKGEGYRASGDPGPLIQHQRHKARVLQVVREEGEEEPDALPDEVEVYTSRQDQGWVAYML